jgi:hypothetical protein
MTILIRDLRRVTTVKRLLVASILVQYLLVAIPSSYSQSVPNSVVPITNEPKPVELNCSAVSDQAMGADMKVATAQSQRLDASSLSLLVDASISLWTSAVERCDGRAKERAQRNLSDSQRARQGLGAELGAVPACTTGHKDANTLQELAQQAVRDRRWLDAAVTYRKAESMWEVAAERCEGNLQEQAIKRREQTAIDGHNAEYCAPRFERAREQTQQFRRVSPDLPAQDRQVQSQVAESLWRIAIEQCKGPAQDLARSSAQTLARERGTPWVATALPSALANPSSGAVGANLAKPVAMGNSSIASAATAAPSTDVEIQAGNTRFVGRFLQENSQISGNGQILWSNGDKYQGDVLRGKRHGQGAFQWSNGQSFIGPWVDDQPRGRGVLRYANGDQYEGDVSGGVPNGSGVLKFASGDVLEARFSNGKAEGQGAFRWISGMTYDGMFASNQPHGKGKMKFADGNLYDGDLVNGQPQGAGSMAYMTGDRYEGTFNQGRPSGTGSYKWSNGDSYIGEWREGAKHGKGQMLWSNGDRWVGVYLDDQQTSDGKLTRKGE